MTLKSEDVRNIAHLARLHIDEDTLDQYVNDLSSILTLVDQMNQVDSSGVVPLANPLDATQRLRADEVTEIDQRDKFQRIAPDVEGGLYRVPGVGGEAVPARHAIGFRGGQGPDGVRRRAEVPGAGSR